MHRLVITSLLPVCVLTLGCVEPFDGSRITLFLNSKVKTPCQALKQHDAAITTAGLTLPKQCTGDRKQDRLLYYYELWATVKRSAIVRLTPFTVQHHIVNDPADPNDYTKYELFEMEKEGVKTAGGDPVRVALDQTFSELSEDEQTEAKRRLFLASSMLSVTSYSPVLYKDAGSKTLADGLFIGNPMQLIQPINGTYHGSIEQTHPFGLANIGGADFTVGPKLEDLSSLWITIESRDPDRADPKPSDLIYLSGTAVESARGVFRVDATSPWDGSVRASFGVLTSLGDEDHF